MKFTERQKKLLIIGGVLLIFASGYRLLPFFNDILSTENEIVAEEKLFTLQKKIQQKKRLEGQKRSLNLQLNQLERGLLQGATYPLAAVTIQNLLYDLAQKNQVDIKSIRVMPPTKSEDEKLSMYTDVAIQARMEVSIRQLEQILYGLAKSSSLLVVDALNVQALNKGQTGRLLATMTIKGLMVAP